MAFILRKDGNHASHEAFTESWRRYQAYLASIADQLPAAAGAFALADWHHDFNDHRAPHDAWIESILVYEKASGQRQEQRQAHIKLRLLGAYHDGHIEIEYTNVVRYCIGAEHRDHGDWGYDEIRISDQGQVLHEIEIGGTTWSIECEDIHYVWLPHDQGALDPAMT